MHRRRFIALLGSAMTAPGALRAQQKAMPVIGYLGAGSSGPTALNIAAFHRELSEAGYVEGQNLVIKYRWAEGRYDRLPALAADLVDRKVDIIVPATTPAALAARNATPLIPIVFVAVADPLATGLVTSLARPGGNITGISVMAAELMPKRLELLLGLAPRAKVIALLVNPNNANAGRMIGDLQAAAHEKGVQLSILNAGTRSRSTPSSRCSSNGKPVRSWSRQIHFFSAGESSSQHWRHAMPFQQSMSFASSPPSAV
jgi:putative ABC transport system substrate-binding protein